MGLISAAVSSVSGVLSDSWKEVIEPDDMSDSTLLVKGVAVKKGSNKKGTDNYVSNGSVIHVYPNTLMLLMDGGKIVDSSLAEFPLRSSMFITSTPLRSRASSSAHATP